VIKINKKVEIVAQEANQAHPVALVLLKLVKDKVIQVEMGHQQAVLKMELRKSLQMNLCQLEL
jgi:hypothetical protein